MAKKNVVKVSDMTPRNHAVYNLLRRGEDMTEDNITAELAAIAADGASKVVWLTKGATVAMDVKTLVLRSDGCFAVSRQGKPFAEFEGMPRISVDAARALGLVK